MVFAVELLIFAVTTTQYLLATVILED